MEHFCLYRISDGHLISVGLKKPVNVAEDLDYKVFIGPSNFRDGKQWDPASLNWIDNPADPVILLRDIMERMGVDKWTELNTAAKTDDVLYGMITYVQGVGYMDTSTERTMNGINYLYSQAYMTAAEIEEVFNVTP